MLPRRHAGAWLITLQAMISIPCLYNNTYRPRLAVFRQCGDQVHKPLPELPQ